MSKQQLFETQLFQYGGDQLEVACPTDTKRGSTVEFKEVTFIAHGDLEKKKDLERIVANRGTAGITIGAA